MSKEQNNSECGNNSEERENVKEKSNSEADNTMSRDDLLKTELGEFGWFQLRTVLLLTIPIMFSAIRNDYILSAASISHRCRIPECGENSKLDIYKPDWILNAIPTTKAGLSSCDRFAPSNLNDMNGSLAYCPASLFDQTEKVGSTELVGPKYRFIGVCLMSMYSLGQVMLGGVYWLIGYWRYATLVLCIPCLFMIVYYWLIPESVRWLLVKKKYAEARKIIENTARVNKKIISDKSMQKLLTPLETPVPELRERKSGVLRTVLHSPVLLRRVCTTPIWWVSGTFVYYGLSINSTGLSDSMYFNYMLTCAVEIPGSYAGSYLLHKVGRKPTLSSAFLFSALCNILFVFMPKGSVPALRLSVYLLGKVAVTVAMTSVYLYTAELYPTQYRHSLLAFSSMVGRLGAIVAPLTPVFNQYWHGTSSVMFGAMGLLAGALALTQPETLGTKLPDTLAEAEQLGRTEATLKDEPR
ncbi:organic cation transporter protein-like [Bicyclus anynana]|uniref:Organic cation transporter protein-like n=1 Tax=Bicyclus anynana TaxID=110368 RepID=A0ABM3LPW8_BICAN|nr:organic cation transporter protein-like [Bicyclus anynana]